MNNDSKLHQHIRNLPVDIIMRIIPYTYQLQNKILLDDIVNYTETRTAMLDKYYNFWCVDMESRFPDEDKHWLINDILSYVNNYNAIVYGYVDKFNNIFRRNLYMRSCVEMYVYQLQDKSVMTQINILLGLLTPEERKDCFV